VTELLGPSVHNNNGGGKNNNGGVGDAKS